VKRVFLLLPFVALLSLASAATGSSFRYALGPALSAEAIRQIEAAAQEWRAVPGTSLGIVQDINGEVAFDLGSNDNLVNPDAYTTTLVVSEGSGGNIKFKNTVFINPEALDDALTQEFGQRLGLQSGGIVGDRFTVGTSETQQLRQLYPKNGDLNGDGKTNIDDLEIFSANYGKSRNAQTQKLTGDFNNDGSVNDNDLAFLQANYEWSFATDPLVPVEARPSDAPPANPSDAPGDAPAPAVAPAAPAVTPTAPAITPTAPATAPAAPTAPETTPPVVTPPADPVTPPPASDEPQR
jgi:hypothetical protein